MRVLGRIIVALVLVASVAVAGVAACAGEPRTDQAKMACCKAMHQVCEKMGNELNCCNGEQNAQQKASGIAGTAVIKASVGLHQNPATVVGVRVVSASASIVPAALDLSGQYKPHSPLYLRHSVLLI